MQDESAFLALTDRVLDAIGAALDAAENGDLDWSENDGVLSVDCGTGGRIIVNRHVPNREIWVAAKSGGFHFRPESGTLVLRVGSFMCRHIGNEVEVGIFE